MYLQTAACVKKLYATEQGIVAWSKVKFVPLSQLSVVSCQMNSAPTAPRSPADIYLLAG
jgi:hypothetical protein